MPSPLKANGSKDTGSHDLPDGALSGSLPQSSSSCSDRHRPQCALRLTFPTYGDHFMNKILLINNDGGGFADYIDVPEGTTVKQLFGQRIPSGKPEDYLIRVNRQPAAADQLLQEGDRVSFTPVKIEGAGT
jgi:hypothetical protein